VTTKPNESTCFVPDAGEHGLTKREHFAALAMQGMLANPTPQMSQADFIKIARWSVKHADALIEELNVTRRQNETQS
jgi:hypothetical protein